MEVPDGVLIVPRPTSAVGPLFSVAAVLIPSRRSGRLGVYDEAAASVIPELRTLGVAAEWSEPAESRAWDARRSADLAGLAVDFVIGISSNAAWQAIVAIVRRRGRQHIRATVGSRETEDATERWVQLEGEGEIIADILRDLNPWAGEGK